jgi:hypothetical protein
MAFVLFTTAFGRLMLPEKITSAIGDKLSALEDVK